MTAAIGLDTPAWLAALLLVPLALWFARMRARRRAALRLEVLGVRRAARGEPRQRTSVALGAVGLACATLALAGPRFGAPTADAEAPGLDLLVALDVSQSMRARDVAPSRLEAARALVADLARGSAGTRLGLVAFAGRARLCIPLTADRTSFLTMLAEVDELSVERGGTDLGAALDTALAAFLGGTGRGAVVVLSDGEDLGGQGQAAARRCLGQGITVSCVGFGQERGAKVPIAGAGGESYLRGPDGAEVVSRPDRAGLAAVAAAGGGGYRDAAAGSAALAEVAAGAPGQAGAGGGDDDAVVVPARHGWLFALALACWLLEFALLVHARAAR